MDEREGLKRKPRRDKGTRLTGRDLTILRWIGEQYAVQMDQPRVLLALHSTADLKEAGKVSESVTRHMIERWSTAGLVKYKKFPVDVPGVVWLTPAGLRTVELPFRPYTPSPSSLIHIGWCNQVRISLAKSRPELTWQSERWLRSALEQRYKQASLPDAVAHGDAIGNIAIEVEISVKSPVRLEEILRERTLVYDQVWYYASIPVRSALDGAIPSLDPGYQQRITVFSLREG